MGIQFALLLALADRAFGLHGVTVICDDKVIILSAASGTGKSTLGRLLHEYCDAAIVNGDFALLTPEADGSLMFEPTPFCGSSGVCHNYRLRVDRIVFLEQAKENAFSDLPPRQALARLLSNTFIPTWDGERALMVQQSALQAVTSVPMNRFAFEPTREAAEMFHSLVTQVPCPHNKYFEGGTTMENKDIRKAINEIEDDALDMVAGGATEEEVREELKATTITIKCPFCGMMYTAPEIVAKTWLKNHVVCCKKNPCL